MTIHDEIAERLAKKFKTEYKQKGIDIITKKLAIEVETKKEGLEQGIRQLAHSSKARYLAVNQNLKDLAKKLSEGTGIGVMGPMGKIIKRASRKGK